MRLSRSRRLFQDPYICQSCLVSRPNAQALHSDRRIPFAFNLHRNRRASQLAHGKDVEINSAGSRTAPRPQTIGLRRGIKPTPEAAPIRLTIQVRKPANNSANPQNLLLAAQKVVDRGQEIISSSTIPDETDVLELLEKCHAISEIVIFGKAESPPQDLENVTLDTSATSSLLDLQEGVINGISKRTVSSTASAASVAVRRQATEQISTLAHSLLLAPQIFISPSILELYVRIQCLLGQPETLPEIFNLYANKSVPKPNTSNPIQYTKSRPKAPSNAIPKNLTEAALSAAITTKNLPLALSIIDTTVQAPAWFRHKLLREASFPIVASATLPFIAYTAATTVGNYQITQDISMATGMVFVGVMTYFIVTGTFGYVALTTFNDHHQRVRWRNIPLTERWVREDERAMFDRLALAWGYKEKWRWGEEEGTEWAALREFVGRRGMILDRSELLEGME